MVLYNWKKIFRKTNKKAIEVIRVFKMLTYKTIPMNERDPIYKYSEMNFHGSSFMLNPEEFLKESIDCSYKERAVYIALASFRSYPEYIISHDPTLDLRKISISQELYKHNPLLSIEDNKLHFKYEDKYIEREKSWH